MSAELVVLVEEQSMQEVLDVVLPKLLPAGWEFKVIPHQGVSDLERSLPRKLRAWRNPGARFIVLRDNDRGNCVTRKARLTRICEQAGRAGQFKVRIVCQELEAWFLGDLPALRIAFGPVPDAWSRPSHDPDSVERPARMLDQQFGGYQKVSGARAIAAHLDLNRNLSTSFNAFLSAVEELTIAA